MLGDPCSTFTTLCNPSSSSGTPNSGTPSDLETTGSGGLDLDPTPPCWGQGSVGPALLCFCIYAYPILPLPRKAQSPGVRQLASEIKDGFHQNGEKRAGSLLVALHVPPDLSLFSTPYPGLQAGTGETQRYGSIRNTPSPTSSFASFPMIGGAAKGGHWAYGQGLVCPSWQEEEGRVLPALSFQAGAFCSCGESRKQELLPWRQAVCHTRSQMWEELQPSKAGHQLVFLEVDDPFCHPHSSSLLLAGLWVRVFLQLYPVSIH